MRARLRPQIPGMEGKPHVVMTQEVYLGPLAAPVMPDWLPYPSAQQQARVLTNRGYPGSISRRLDDMLSTPFNPYIINYEPPRGFMVSKFSTYDRTNDSFDHIMHYRQLMTLDIGNDVLLCKQNISTLQNIKMLENESLREFVKQFGQAILQVESCIMDPVLQIFKSNICSGTPLFESLTKKPPSTMDDLFKRANKYSMLEDDVHAATQQVLVTIRPVRNNSDRTIQVLTTSTALRAVIKYIHGWPVDEKYNSKRKRQMLLRAASIREQVSMRPIDRVITIHLVDPNQVLQSHEDALILTLGINDFDVRQILVDPGSLADLESRVDTIKIQWSLNNFPERCRATHPSWTDYPKCAVLSGRGLVPFQCHHETHMATWHEGHPLYVSPNGELSNRRQTYRPLWQPTGCTLMLSGSTLIQIHQRSLLAMEELKALEGVFQ
ncbi:hypothetical protein AAG906_001765 [Vitis piasezkii]